MSEPIFKTNTTDRERLRDLLAAAPRTNSQRGEWALDEFRRRGGQPRRLDLCSPAGTPMAEFNIEVTVPSDLELLPVYVTAHHDHVAIGDGVVDNWSGVVAMFQLYERFRSQPLRRPLVLLSFACEEGSPYGLLYGSRCYVAALAGSAVLANVNLECLGPGPLHYWTYAHDPIPKPAAIPEAPYRGCPSDARSFHSVGSSAIVFDGIAARTDRIVHTERDRIEAIDMQYYERSLDQIEQYLRLLDRQALEAA